MILNGYAILDLFVSGLRIALAMFLVIGGVRTLRAWRQGAASEASAVREDRVYLLCLVGTVLLALHLAAWPVFYLLLQSYVPHWPGVMCIHGVTRIGLGSVGVSRFLPSLVATIEILRPAVIFLAGAWFVLYLMNRASAGARLARQVLVLAIVVGLIGFCDAALEAAYLTIPKVEKHLSSGCCSAAATSVSRSDADGERWAAVTPQVVTILAAAPLAGMLLGLGAAIVRPVFGDSGWRLGLLVVGATASLITMTIFVPRLAAPHLLGLPQHHCVYCMFHQVPESAVAMLLLVAGAFLVGWAAVACVASSNGLQDLGAAYRARLLRWAFWAYLGFVVMFSLVWLLA